MARKEKLLGVQYLRGIAALMVAYYHLQSQIPAFTAELSFDRIVNSARLSSGVYVFFVVSGFIMYVTGRKLSAGDFVWRRLTRIIPLYWAVTIMVCLLALAEPRVLHRTDVTLDFFIKSLLFIPYANPTQQNLFFPILVPGWSLNYEMAFYGLFAAALFAPLRWRMWIVGIALAMCVLAGMIHSGPEMRSEWGFYTSNRLLLFMAGLGLGAVYTRLQLPKLVCAIFIGAGFWLILANFPSLGMIWIAQLLGSVAIVTGAVIWECQYGLPRWRALLLLGDASYSIYLVHLFAFGLTRELWKRVPLHGIFGATAFGIVSMAMVVGIAVVTYRVIERPASTLMIRRHDVESHHPLSQVQ